MIYLILPKRSKHFSLSSQRSYNGKNDYTANVAIYQTAVKVYQEQRNKRRTDKRTVETAVHTIRGNSEYAFLCRNEAFIPYASMPARYCISICKSRGKNDRGYKSHGGSDRVVRSIYYIPRLFTHAAMSASDSSPTILPSIHFVESAQSGFSTAAALPRSLPPLVAKGTTVLPAKS